MKCEIIATMDLSEIEVNQYRAIILSLMEVQLHIKIMTMQEHSPVITLEKLGIGRVIAMRSVE